MGSPHTISPLYPTSFKIGNTIHKIAVVGIVANNELDSPIAVADQDPVMDKNHRTVKNASRILPVTQTSPGAEG